MLPSLHLNEFELRPLISQHGALLLLLLQDHGGASTLPAGSLHAHFNSFEPWLHVSAPRPPAVERHRLPALPERGRALGDQRRQHPHLA